MIWGIGIPATGLALLVKFKQRLDTWEVQRYLLMLYQGLNQDRFYWEFINTFRKSLLLSISVFMSTSPLLYRILIATVIMVIMRDIQKRLKPYKLMINNRLELNEIMTGSATIFASMIFNDQESTVVVVERTLFILGKTYSRLTTLLIVLIFNIRFFLFWIY